MSLKPPLIYCVSHYVKTSVLEAAILRAIQAVSKYVLENEAEFIDQLKAVWNEHQARASDNGQQELAEAKKRIADLDEKINKLYESSVNGLLPERQAQRMIQQYDEEQLVLEKRVAELESLVQQDEIKQVDASRFIALVRKYRDCEELTDTIERANRKKKLTRKELKDAAKTDPEAAKAWEALKAKEAEARQRKKEREEARMAADPEYAAMMAERKAEYVRTRTARRKAEHEALVELAKTDEEAARKLAEKRKYQSEATVRCYQKMKADAEAGDPEAIRRYEATLAKRRDEYHKKKARQEEVPA